MANKKNEISKDIKKGKEKVYGFFGEFKKFIQKGNVFDLAIGVIIGGAFSKIVTAINVNIISPLIAWIIGDTDLSNSLITVLKSHKEATEADVAAGLAKNVGDVLDVPVNDIVISWGALIQAIIDFLLIAIILFVIIKVCSSVAKRARATAEKLRKKEEEQEPEVAPEPQPVPADIALLTEIRDLLKSQEKNDENK